MGYLTSASQHRRNVSDARKPDFSLSAYSNSLSDQKKNTSNYPMDKLVTPQNEQKNAVFSHEIDLKPGSMLLSDKRSTAKSRTAVTSRVEPAESQSVIADKKNQDRVLLPNGRMAAISGSFSNELRVLCAVPYQMIWCAERDGGLNCREAMNGKWVSWIKPPDARVKNRYFPTCIVVTSCFDVWIGSTIGVIDVYDGYSSSFKRQLLGHHGQVSCLLSVGDLNGVLSGGNDFSIACWNVHTYSELWRLHRNDNNITAIAVSLPFLVSGSASGQVKFWKLQAERQPRNLAMTYPHRRKVTALAVCDDFLACASEDGSLKLMSISSQSVLQGFSFKKNVMPTSLTVTSETIWIGCTDGRIRCLDIHGVQNGDMLGPLRELENSSTAITGFYEVQRHAIVLLHVLTEKNNIHTYLHQPLESRYIDSEYHMNALLTSMDSLHLNRTKLWGLNASISVARDTLKKNSSRIVSINEMVGNILVSSFSRAERCLSFQKLLLLASKPRGKSSLKENKDLKLLRQFYTRMRPLKETKLQEAQRLEMCKTIRNWHRIAQLRKFFSSWNTCLKISKEQGHTNQKQILNVGEMSHSVIKSNRYASVERQNKMRLFGKVQTILNGKVQALLRGLIFERWKCFTQVKQVPSVEYASKKTTKESVGSRRCFRKLRTASANLHRLSRKTLLQCFFQRWLKLREGLPDLTASEQATRRDEISITTERLAKSSLIFERKDPIAEVNAMHERILAAKAGLKQLLELADRLEFECTENESESDQNSNSPGNVEKESLGSLSEQQQMITELIRLKAKAVICHRDMKEIRRIHDTPTKELPAVLRQGIFTCAQYIHKIHETDYYPANGERWKLDISARSSNSLVAFRKEVLCGLRTAIIARDCIANRDDIKASLTNSIQLDLATEILSNIDIMIALVDRYSKGNVFSGRSTAASTDGHSIANDRAQHTHSHVRGNDNLHAATRKPQIPTRNISL
ncbi:serine/threonine protein kinase [Perkinsela sp. CCAP 1560/4]|nr:serine/threonine protein kinase [Perkinsela sp. CCAP 1560/4]|eukprot:KNH06198.1 serine/threonine protein kinase [Perkinsela sp. CCAP 1560/4]